MLADALGQAELFGAQHVHDFPHGSFLQHVDELEPRVTRDTREGQPTHLAILIEKRVTEGPEHVTPEAFLDGGKPAQGKGPGRTIFGPGQSNQVVGILNGQEWLKLLHQQRHHATYITLSSYGRNIDEMIKDVAHRTTVIVDAPDLLMELLLSGRDPLHPRPSWLSIEGLLDLLEAALWWERSVQMNLEMHTPATLLDIGQSCHGDSDDNVGINVPVRLQSRNVAAASCG